MERRQSRRQRRGQRRGQDEETRNTTFWVLFLLFTVSQVILGLLIAHFSPYECLTDNCIEKAKLIMNNMNTTADPCNDFYKFVCGYSKEQEKFQSHDLFSRITEVIYSYERNIFMEPNNTSKDKMTNFIARLNRKCNVLAAPSYINYYKCLAMSVTGTIFNETSWNSDSFSIEDFEYESNKKGFTGKSLFCSHLTYDIKQSGGVSISIGSPNLRFVTPEHILSLERREALYKDTINQLFENDLNFHMDGNLISRVFHFELALAKILTTSWKNKGKSHIITLEKLEEYVPYINFIKYFRQMVPKKISVYKKAKVTITNMDYFQNMASVIKKTPKYTIYLYMVYRNLLEVFPYMLTEVDFQQFRNAFETIDRNMLLLKENRASFCREIIIERFGGAITSMILRHFRITHSGREVLVGVAKELQRQLRFSIKKSTWMDSGTKSRAIKKLKETTLTYLSLPDNEFKDLSDPELFNLIFEDFCFTIIDNSMINVILNINKFFLNQEIKLIKKKIVIVGYNVHNNAYLPLTYYHPAYNALIVPPGILGFPAFHKDWPKYLIYGGIGSVMSSELQRSVFNEGSYFDEKGMWKYWWSNSTKDNFVKIQSNCFLNKEYKSIDFPVQKLQIQIEGLQLAYKAYMKYLDKISEASEPVLPGLTSYSHKEMFFISFANIYCNPKESVLSERNQKSIIYYMTKLGIFKESFGCQDSKESDEDLFKCLLM